MFVFSQSGGKFPVWLMRLSRTCHLLQVFPHFPFVKCFPALTTCYVLSRAFPALLNIFPRFPIVTRYPVLSTCYIFSRACHFFSRAFHLLRTLPLTTCYKYGCISEEKKNFSYLDFNTFDCKSSPLVLDIDAHSNNIFFFGVSKGKLIGP